MDNDDPHGRRIRHRSSASSSKKTTPTIVLPVSPQAVDEWGEGELFVEPWILDDDVDEDSARVMKSSLFPYAGGKRVRSATPAPRKPRKPSAKMLAIRLGTRNLMLRQLTSEDWPSFKAVEIRRTDWSSFRAAQDADESYLRSQFQAHLDQWQAQNIGSFLVYVNGRPPPQTLQPSPLLRRTTPGPDSASLPPSPMARSSSSSCPTLAITSASLPASPHPQRILKAKDCKVSQHLAGQIHLWLQPRNPRDGRPCLHIRTALLPQYRGQRRVLLESLHGIMDWVVIQRRLFDQYPRVYIPLEVGASRQNAIAMGDDDTGAVLIPSDQGVQQQMIVVHRARMYEVLERLFQAMSSPELIQHVINTDIFSTKSDRNLFELVVKWEIPLLKIDEHGSIHLFMSTYHDTVVETLIKGPLPEPGPFKMRLDLCSIAGSVIHSTCRIKTKDVNPAQNTIAFSGVRKSKVGDKSKLYVIRCQLLRGDDKKNLTLIDTCLSSVCHMTSSRRVYRAAEDSAGGRPAPSDSSTLDPTTNEEEEPDAWQSESPLLERFLDCCKVYWKTGYPYWLFTQEKVVLELADLDLDEPIAIKIRLVDLQSNLPIQLVSMAGGTRSTTPLLVIYASQDGTFSADLRVSSKKEVMNRSSYLVVGLHRVDDSRRVAVDAITEFVSTFVVSVGTTYASLRRRHSRPCDDDR